jgi:hypothetical protein
MQSYQREVDEAMLMAKAEERVAEERRAIAALMEVRIRYYLCTSLHFTSGLPLLLNG